MYASALRSSVTQAVLIGLRSAGGAEISETARSPYTVKRERPGNRGRGHVEHVRASPLGERGALLDAEAVLLVDDGDGQVGELDLALDQRVRADRDAHVAGRDELVGGAALACGEARGEERDTDAELRAQPLDREEMLLGERLRRRHQGALAPCLDRAQQRVEGDGGLAGADVPLEQALHRRRPGEIGVDLGDRAVLRRREREREHVAVRGDELRRGWQRLGDEHLPLRGTSSEGELEREQLVEREAPAGLLGLGVRARAMEPDERVGAQWQQVARADGRGERLAPVPREARARPR